MNTIGDKIRKERIKKGYTQEYMATILNIDQKTFSHYESDKTKVTAESLVKIAGVLEVPVQDLLPESNPSTINSSEQQGGNSYNFIFVGNDEDSNKDTKSIPSLDDKLTSILQNIQKLLEKLPQK